MRCRKAEKLMMGFVTGRLSSRREAGVRSHLATCEPCSDFWERERIVEENLSAWPDLPLPPDALASIEARIDFAPPPAALPRRGTVRSLVLPYVAGLATAAAILLVAQVDLSPGRTEAPPAVSPGSGGPVAEADTGSDAEPELRPGERTLTFVDRSGGLREVPWDAETERYLRQRMSRAEYEQFLRRATETPVDYEVK